jgi:hypothetical protein
MTTGVSTAGQRTTDPLKIYYADDPDPEKAGQGLALAPLIYQNLPVSHSLYWMMSPAEQMALTFLLERLRPKVAIEIGSRDGGSLQVTSQLAERVFSLDIDPLVPKRLEGFFPNVEYLIGPSDQTLPPLVDRLQAEDAELSFALVDGDHSSEGVRKDIDNLLRYRPRVPFYIIMHDSFNPECRDGLRRAAWADCPYVHAVELDFVAGVVNPAPTFGGQLWGGLALGVLLPEPRKGRFEIVGRSALTYEASVKAEKARKSIPARALRKLRRILARWINIDPAPVP